MKNILTKQPNTALEARQFNRAIALLYYKVIDYKVPCCKGYNFTIIYYLSLITCNHHKSNKKHSNPKCNHRSTPPNLAYGLP